MRVVAPAGQAKLEADMQLKAAVRPVEVRKRKKAGSLLAVMTNDAGWPPQGFDVSFFFFPFSLWSGLGGLDWVRAMIRSLN
jgi:hypothetical protein